MTFLCSCISRHASWHNARLDIADPAVSHVGRVLPSRTVRKSNLVDIVLASVGCCRRCRAGRQNRRLDRPKVGHHSNSRAIRHMLAHSDHNKEHHQHICREVYRWDWCRGGVCPGARLRRRDCPDVNSGRPGHLFPSALLLGDSLLVCGGCLLLLRDLQHRLLRHPTTLCPKRALHAGIADVVDATRKRRSNSQSSVNPTRIALRH